MWVLVFWHQVHGQRRNGPSNRAVHNPNQARAESLPIVSFYSFGGCGVDPCGLDEPN